MEMDLLSKNRGALVRTLFAYNRRTFAVIYARLKGDQKFLQLESSVVDEKQRLVKLFEECERRYKETFESQETLTSEENYKEVHQKLSVIKDRYETQEVQYKKLYEEMSHVHREKAKLEVELQTLKQERTFERSRYEELEKQYQCKISEYHAMVDDYSKLKLRTEYVEEQFQVIKEAVTTNGTHDQMFAMDDLIRVIEKLESSFWEKVCRFFGNLYKKVQEQRTQYEKRTTQKYEEFIQERKEELTKEKDRIIKENIEMVGTLREEFSTTLKDLEEKHELEINQLKRENQAQREKYEKEMQTMRQKRTEDHQEFSRRLATRAENDMKLKNDTDELRENAVGQNDVIKFLRKRLESETELRVHITFDEYKDINGLHDQVDIYGSCVTILEILEGTKTGKKDTLIKEVWDKITSWDADACPPWDEIRKTLPFLPEEKQTTEHHEQFESQRIKISTHKETAREEESY